MRLWVTGATGYLGRELLRLVPAADGTRVEVRDAGAVAAHALRARPQAIVNAAYRQDEDPWGVNAVGAGHVAAAAAAAGARLVHLSTDVVFDGRKGAPYVEEDEPAPLTEYGRTKAEAERRVLGACPGALLVRTSLIYGGPGCEPSKHELAVDDPEAAFFTNEIRSPVQVTDLARAVLELVALDVAGPLHVAGADDLSRHAFAELVAGRRLRSAAAPPARPLDCSLDSSRARALLRTRLRGAREVLGGDPGSSAKSRLPP